ncbi:MAG TPA: hypothetical protein VK363_02150 [Pyrinomonadaceae bacterium]|nr:hypothetical protein [Pyrinomonadaceae bacterium]
MTPEERDAIKKQLAEELKGANDESRREALAKLKADLREEIDKDAIKKEVLRELAPKESAAEKNLKHPASLLVIGFVLTTLFGTIISSCWKYLEWENEQEYLKTQTQCERERQTRSEEIKQKYEVKDEIIKRVAETNTAAEDILLYFQLEPARRESEREERIKYWKEASRNWRINDKILRQRLLLRFKNPDVSELFNEMTRYRGWVGININNQQDELSKGEKPCAAIIDQANLCMGHVTGNIMPQVIKIMNEEIWADEKELRAARCLTTALSQPTVTPSPTLQTADAPNSKSAPSEPNACMKLRELAKVCDPEKQPDQK